MIAGTEVARRAAQLPLGSFQFLIWSSSNQERRRHRGTLPSNPSPTTSKTPESTIPEPITKPQSIPASPYPFPPSRKSPIRQLTQRKKECTPQPLVSEIPHGEKRTRNPKLRLGNKESKCFVVHMSLQGKRKQRREPLDQNLYAFNKSLCLPL
jgi:hypothetical protein